MAGNPFSARASFTVGDPNVPANALAQLATSERQSDARNFQSGINNAITQAAQSRRNQLNNQAAMERQVEAEAFRRQLQQEQNSFAQQQAIAKEDRAFKRQFQGQDAVNNLLIKSVETAGKLGLSKDQLGELVSGGLEAIQQNNTDGSVNNELATSFLEKLTPQQQEALVQESTQFEAAPGSSLLPDEQGDLISTANNQALSGGLVANEPAPTTSLLDNLFNESNKLARMSEAKVQEQEGKAGIGRDEGLRNEMKAHVITDLINSGVNIDQEELQGYDNIDRNRALAMQNDKAADQMAKKAEEFRDDLSPQLITMTKDLDGMLGSLKQAEQGGVKITLNAKKVLRSGLEKVGDADGQGTQEILAELKSKNIFDFGDSIYANDPEAQARITNAYLTGLDQLESQAAFLARLGGEKGTLTNQDISRAMKKFLSLNGGLSQYVDNMSEGYGKLAGVMTRKSYLYEDTGAFHAWRGALQNSGHKLNKSGIPVKINNAETGQFDDLDPITLGQEQQPSFEPLPLEGLQGDDLLNATILNGLNGGF